ncbi:hypothetical protein [Microbispora sp. ATCC PTA-5024]|uniref:hypothetical protein n=1 Tax=Microbispora sp. ATCC PTA-5024 TaxID=316330 RepID=UPI0003DBDAC1|nr:hypothetical protein [Microbispora sp. ATCC PTA-5024]ETK33098.1 hypothetical protein MPTA5024_26215 [Microbispora sp. ATCC PTA-5024]
MGEKSVLKSKARGRVVRRAAGAGVVSAGVLLGGLAVVSAHADTKTVSYTCTPSSGAAVTHDFTVSLTANGSAAVGTAFTATLTLSSGASALPAPVAIGADKWIQVEPSISASGAAGVSTPSPSASLGSTPVGSPMGALPVATITVTPSTGATAVVLTARDFKLNLLGSAASGSTTPELLYDCKISTTGVSTLPAVATVAVGTASSTPSASTSPSTSTSPTPRHTRTVYETVTASPSKSRRSGQVTHTPGGGAATGGGGEAGPDGRVLVLTGTGLMLAAATGGLMMRARRRPVRQ